MMSLVTRYVVALVGTACVVEGYWVYLQKTVLGGPARGPQERIDAGRAPLPLEEWFRERATAAGIRSDIAVTHREVIVTFRVPGLQADSVKVSIDGGRVTIVCVAGVIEDRDGPGGGYRREALRQYELVLPVPAHADAARHRVVGEGETFRIIFERFDDPLLKS